MIATGLAPTAIHALLNDDPASIVRHDEAVQVKIEAILNGGAIDLGRKKRPPTRRSPKSPSLESTSKPRRPNKSALPSRSGGSFTPANVPRRYSLRPRSPRIPLLLPSCLRFVVQQASNDHRRRGVQMPVDPHTSQASTSTPYGRDTCDATYRLLSAREGRRAAAAAEPLQGAAALGPDWLGAGHGRSPAQERSSLLRPHSELVNGRSPASTKQRGRLKRRYYSAASRCHRNPSRLIIAAALTNSAGRQRRTMPHLVPTMRAELAHQEVLSPSRQARALAVGHGSRRSRAACVRASQGMNMVGCEPSELRCGHGIAGIAIGLDLVTQSHPDLPVPLLLNGPEVLTVVAVALIAAADLDLEEVHSLDVLRRR